MILKTFLSWPGSKTQNQDGFALIDVVVAFVISSLILLLLFEAISQNLTATEKASERYRAGLLAQSKLAELGNSVPLADGVTQGRFDDKFSWSLTVHQDPDLEQSHADSPLQAYAVHLDVSWGRGAKSYHTSFDTLRLGVKSP